MILWITLLINLVLSLSLATYCTDTALGAVIVFCCFYFLCGIFGAIVAGFVSLALGRNAKPTLRKKERYFITQEDELYFYYLYRGQELRFPRMSTTSYETDDEELAPYLEIRYYNMGGWRRWLLIPLYEDKKTYHIYTHREKS